MIINIILFLFGIILIALSINHPKFKKNNIYLLVGIVLLVISSLQFLKYTNTSEPNFSF